MCLRLISILHRGFLLPFWSWSTYICQCTQCMHLEVQIPQVQNSLLNTPGNFLLSLPRLPDLIIFWELPWVSYNILQAKNSVTLERSVSLTFIGNTHQLCLTEFSFQTSVECRHLRLSLLSSFGYKVPQLAWSYYSSSLLFCATIMTLLQSVSDHITPLTLNLYTASDFF